MQNKNRGVRKLALQLKGVSEERIAVLLAPGTEMDALPKLTSLSEWRAQ